MEKIRMEKQKTRLLPRTAGEPAEDGKETAKARRESSVGDAVTNHPTRAEL
jgi:hypothetical protein